MHIPLVCFGIAFPVLVLFAEYRYLRTGDDLYRVLARRWSRVMLALFAFGVVTGTILSFELGLLWPAWMADFGNVFGLGFTLEGFSFFLEAIFIGIYAYGLLRCYEVSGWWWPTAAGRPRREKIRLQAAEWFAEGVRPPEVAGAAGLAEFGVRVAAVLAGARRGCPGLRRSWRGGVPSGAQLERLRGRAGGLPGGMRLAAATGAWICLEDEAGQNLRPPKARTWARRGGHPGGRQGLGPGVGRGAGVPQARQLEVTCSTGSASTAGPRASAARCPKPITLA